MKPSGQPAYLLPPTELPTLPPGLNEALSQALVGHSALIRAIEQLVSAGGKRLRPRLVYLSGQLCGADPAQLHAPAAAVELVHAASLLHDDVMDKASTRRGATAAWRSWGPDTAILAGDLALVRALELLQRSPPLLTTRLVRAMGEMVQGQALEVEQRHQLAGGMRAWRAVADGKTAALMAWAAEAGGLVSGDETAAEALRSYGRSLGQAFQLLDDLLDLVPRAGTGKPPLADLREGAPSAPLRLAAELDPGLAHDVNELWRGAGADLEFLAARITAIAAPRALAMLDEIVLAACQSLSCFPQNTQRHWLERAAMELSGRGHLALKTNPAPSQELTT